MSVIDSQYLFGMADDLSAILINNLCGHESLRSDIERAINQLNEIGGRAVDIESTASFEAPINQPEE